jgi:hypothetical protein
VDASAFASVVSNFSVFTCRLSSISYYRTIDDIPLSCSCSFPPWMKIYIYIYIGQRYSIPWVWNIIPYPSQPARSPADRGTHLSWLAASDFLHSPADPRRHPRASDFSATHNTHLRFFFSFVLLLSPAVQILLVTFFFNVRKIDFHIQFSNIVGIVIVLREKSMWWIKILLVCFKKNTSMWQWG